MYCVKHDGDAIPLLLEQVKEKETCGLGIHVGGRYLADSA
jgi:hypothetical protein